jgi:hypothetical protein
MFVGQALSYPVSAIRFPQLWRREPEPNRIRVLWPLP